MPLRWDTWAWTKAWMSTETDWSCLGVDEYLQESAPRTEIRQIGKGGRLCKELRLFLGSLYIQKWSSPDSTPHWHAERIQICHLHLHTDLLQFRVQVMEMEWWKYGGVIIQTPILKLSSSYGLLRLRTGTGLWGFEYRASFCLVFLRHDGGCWGDGRLR